MLICVPQEFQEATMIAELAGAYAAETHTIPQLVQELRAIASGNLSRATSEATDVAGQVKAYLEWLDDPLPEVAQSLGQRDKFARLIELSRRYPECNAFYLNEADLNSSTLWRWSNGKSRPSRYIATSIVDDIKPVLVSLLWKLCDKHGLCRKTAATAPHETDPVLEAAGSALRSVRDKTASNLARVGRRVARKPA
jgi:hypothetical protein